MTVTFCGHRVVANPQAVELWLTGVVESLIKEGATQFYLGGYGQFDELAFQVVRQWKKTYPHIKTIYVMAYLNRVPRDIDWYDDTTYPPIEEGPQRFAISRRNKWMATACDVLVVYLRYDDVGGAAAMYKQARRQGKPCIHFPIP
ncbi:hypothetical protein RFF05_17080 [Bengtsoniella intestinalis]|uniref:hypothetical protein n=1 Tax=Bengtsoniella intestinalis TaxID=3073143 RepID=UPI00391F00DE